MTTTAAEELHQLQLMKHEEVDHEEHLIEAIDKSVFRGIDAGDVKKLQDKVLYTCNGFAKKPFTGTAAPIRMKSVIGITTGSEALKELLGGEIETSAMTEAIREFWSGKTQHAQTLCVTQMLGPEGEGKENSHAAAYKLIVISEFVPDYLMGLTLVEQRSDDSTFGGGALRLFYQVPLHQVRVPESIGDQLQRTGSEDNEGSGSGEGGAGGGGGGGARRSTNPINPALLTLSIVVIGQNGERHFGGQRQKRELRTMEEFCSWVHQCWVNFQPGRQPVEVMDRQNLWPGYSLFLYDRHGPYNRNLDEIEDGWPFTVFIGALNRIEAVPMQDEVQPQA